MSIKRWENWLHMFHLWQGMDDPGLSDPMWQKQQKFGAPLFDVILADGQFIDFNDEAVGIFLQIIHLDASAPGMTLRDVFLRIGNSFITDFTRPGLHGYDSTQIDKLMTCREQPGGWTQIDRLIKQLGGYTFSQVVDRKQGGCLTHPDDQWMDGKTCYSLGILTYYDGSYAKPYQAFASEPKYAMALIEQVLARFDRSSDPWDFDYKKPSQIWIDLNGNTLCTLPLQCTSGHELAYEGVVDKDGHTCFSVTEPVWKDFSWEQHDHKLMNAFAKAAPDEAKRYIKGSFITDELGV
jgi:hypothetical protein